MGLSEMGHRGLERAQAFQRKIDLSRCEVRYVRFYYCTLIQTMGDQFCGPLKQIFVPKLVIVYYHSLLHTDLNSGWHRLKLFFFFLSLGLVSMVIHRTVND